MADQILPKGIRLFNKKDSQPEFVIGSMVITLNELFQYAKDNPTLITEYNGEKQLKFQIAKSQNGNLYCSVDTWKPNVPAQASADFKKETKLPETGGLPF